MKLDFEAIGGRRYLMAILSLVVSTALLVLDRISDAIWRDVMIAIVAVYVTGNTAQKAIDRRGEA